jgi:small subunit ribosomal protein S3
VGHKTHPLGFRLGITQEYFSVWHSKLKDYSLMIKNDSTIRKEVFEFLEMEKIDSNGVSKILIKRNRLRTDVEIHTAHPGLIIGNDGKRLFRLHSYLNKISNESLILLNIIEIKNPYTEANLVANEVISELENREAFRRTMKTSMQRVLASNIKGIKIQIAGRLNGAEIARTEWLREGRVPLQTLRAKIDYSYKIAETLYGILGVKIWLFKGELINNEII